MIKHTVGKLMAVRIEEDGAVIEVAIRDVTAVIPVIPSAAAELAGVVGKEIELCFYRLLSPEEQAAQDARIQAAMAEHGDRLMGRKETH